MVKLLIISATYCTPQHKVIDSIVHAAPNTKNGVIHHFWYLVSIIARKIKSYMQLVKAS